MNIRDQNIDPASAHAQKYFTARISTAVSQTNAPILRFRPKVGFELTGVRSYCSVKAGTVTLDVRLVGAAAIITATTITVHSTPEQLAVAAFYAVANGRYVAKAAQTGITFTAAHVVSAGKYGVVLLQMDNAGTISTKVPAATQAYDAAAQATAALPAADAGKVAIGWLRIQAKAGAAWTANTDDMTAGSDLQAITITNNPVTAASALAAVNAPVALEVAESTLSTTPANIRDRTGTKDVLVLMTTDGSGSLTNGEVTVQWRPFPLHGEQY